MLPGAKAYRKKTDCFHWNWDAWDFWSWCFCEKGDDPWLLTLNIWTGSFSDVSLSSAVKSSVNSWGIRLRPWGFLSGEKQRGCAGADVGLTSLSIWWLEWEGLCYYSYENNTIHQGMIEQPKDTRKIHFTRKDMISDFMLARKLFCCFNKIKVKGLFPRWT